MTSFTALSGDLAPVIKLYTLNLVLLLTNDLCFVEKIRECETRKMLPNPIFLDKRVVLQIFFFCLNIQKCVYY